MFAEELSDNNTDTTKQQETVIFKTHAEALDALSKKWDKHKYSMTLGAYLSQQPVEVKIKGFLESTTDVTIGPSIWYVSIGGISVTVT